MSPYAYFCSALGSPPNWPLALASPLLCVALRFVTGLYITNKSRALFESAPGGFAAMSGDLSGFGIALSAALASSYLIAYGIAVMAVIAIDVLLKDSRRG